MGVGQGQHIAIEKVEHHVRADDMRVFCDDLRVGQCRISPQGIVKLKPIPLAGREIPHHITTRKVDELKGVGPKSA